MSTASFRFVTASRWHAGGFAILVLIMIAFPAWLADWQSDTLLSDSELITVFRSLIADMVVIACRLVVDATIAIFTASCNTGHFQLVLGQLRHRHRLGTIA